MAIVKLVRYMEETLESDISEGGAATLAQRLSPESTTSFLGSDTGFEARAKLFKKRFETVWAKVTTEISEKYKTQVSKLVTKSLSTRGTSRYHYKGPNPALDREDVMELLKFAMEYDLDVELLYVKQNDQETRVVVSPKGIEGDRVYAHNPSTDSDGIYNVARILKARML